MGLGLIYLIHVTIPMDVIYSNGHNNGGAGRVFLIAFIVIWPYLISAHLFLRRVTGTAREFWSIASTMVLSTVAMGIAIANGAGPITIPILTVLQAYLFSAVARAVFRSGAK
jgi:hypothetical protein